MISEEDYPVWNGYLYQLQEEAPRPKPVVTTRPEAAVGRPSHFGLECHGLITREEGDALCKEEGNFLIRESKNERGRYTLVLRILGGVKNFKLYWENGQFFVGDKRFDSIYALVEDGLITMYVEEKAHDYIQNMSKDRSVYSSLSRTKRLLTRQSPSYGEPMTAKADALASPRRAASVRAGHGNSPRHAHNGRNTEGAALPYTHYQNHVALERREYFDPSCGKQGETIALEDQFIATHMINEDNTYFQNSMAHLAHFHPNPKAGSVIRNLANGKTGPLIGSPCQNGNPCIDASIVNGAKKSLTPTSSDERKRPKAKKVATEEAVSQQHYDGHHDNGTQFVQASPVCMRNQYDHRRSPSNSSNSNTDSEGRNRYYARPHVPALLQNRPFHQSVPSSSPRNSPHRSPMPRKNSDPIHAPQTPYQCSMIAQLMQTNVAHVRQLGGHNAAVGPNATGPVSKSETSDYDERVMLDANENQMVVSTPCKPNTQRYISPSRTRHSPRQSGFDSSGSEVIPASTFHQLRMFHKRLEEAPDDDMRKEAQDEVTTLRGHLKTPVRLTRSHTTAGMAQNTRPHSGGTATPRPTPRDIHFRQRSEPVELFQKFSPRKGNLQNSNPQVSPMDNAIYRQQGRATRNKESYLTGDQGDLRAASSGSCDSSLSNVSSAGGTPLHHIPGTYFKPQDSISHLSSEDWTGEERESSPSPHSTSHRSYSSDDNSLSKVRLGRQNMAVTYEYRDAATAKYQQASPQKSKEEQARRGGRDASKAVTSNQGSVCVPPPETLNAPKPRRKGSDFETSQGQANGINKSRHHSETSSEEGYARHPLPAHKPLQRRATTGSPFTNKNIAHTNGSAPVVKTPSPKKTAHRSSSGPSPRKGKKSPDGAMSPRAQHIHHQRSLSSPRNDVPYYDKEHVFKSHTYRGLQWCEYCGNFMWGIIQQGMQCRDCGLNVHKQCSKLVPGDCQPALKHVKTVFGIDLTALVKLHGTERPVVVDKCIAEIERRGVNSEGIYRVSGFHDDVQQLKLEFDRYGSEVELSRYEDINIVAGGLKLYLRELPVPLIPYTLYSRFINATKLSYEDGKVEAIQTALDVMPPAHLQTLKHIIHHLGRICGCGANHMDSQNLGIVFGPTMLRPPEKSVPARYNLNDAQYQKEIVQTMIDNRFELFGPQNDMPIRETHNL